MINRVATAKTEAGKLSGTDTHVVAANSAFGNTANYHFAGAAGADGASKKLKAAKTARDDPKTGSQWYLPSGRL